MRTINLSLPAYYRIIGWIFFLPSLILGVLFVFLKFDLPFLSYGESAGKLHWTGQYNFTDEIITTFFIIGIFFICFSRRSEHETLMSGIRLHAIYASVIANSIVVVICLGLNSTDFAAALIGNIMYDMYILLLFFLVSFYYFLRRSKLNKNVNGIILLKYSPYRIIGVWGTFAYLALLIISLVPPFQMDIPKAAFIPLPIIILMLLWSEERNDDESISFIRAGSMCASFFFNYAAILVANWAVYGLPYYFDVMIGSMISVPVFYFIIFGFSKLIIKIRKEKDQRVLINIP